MNKNNITITIKKALRSIFRDKKTVALILLFPLLIAFFVFYLSSTYENSINDQKVYTVAINYEPNEIETKLIKENQLKIKKYSDLKSMEEAFKNHDVYSYVYYDEKENKYIIYSDEGREGMSSI